MPAELPPSLRKSPNFGVEVDAMPGGFVCSGSMKFKKLDPDVAKDAFAGRKSVRKLFTKEQRAFYAAHAPAGLELDDLAVLGPIFVLKLKFAPPELDRRLVAEMWLYPDDSRIVELSTKCAPADAFRVAAETRGYLAEKGFDRTTVADICKAADISTGSLFHYFPTKRAIFLAIFEQDGEDNAEVFARARTLSPWDGVLMVVDHLCVPALDRTVAGLVLEVVTQASRDPELWELVARNEQVVRDELARLLQAAGKTVGGGAGGTALIANAGGRRAERLPDALREAHTAARELLALS